MKLVGASSSLTLAALSQENRVVLTFHANLHRAGSVSQLTLSKNEFTNLSSELHFPSEGPCFSSKFSQPFDGFHESFDGCLLLGLASRRIALLRPSRGFLMDPDSAFSLPNHTGWVRTLCSFGAGSGLLLSAACNYIKAWNLTSRRPRHLQDTRIFVGDILDLSVAPWRLEGGSCASLPSLYAASNDGVVFGFRVHPQHQGSSRPILEELVQRKVAEARINAIAGVYDSDGNPFAACCTSDGFVLLLDASSLAVLDRQTHGSKVHSLRRARSLSELSSGVDTSDLGRAGSHFVTASEDGTAVLWRVVSGGEDAGPALASASVNLDLAKQSSVSGVVVGLPDRERTVPPRARARLERVATVRGAELATPTSAGESEGRGTVVGTVPIRIAEAIDMSAIVGVGSRGDPSASDSIEPGTGAGWQFVLGRRGIGLESVQTI